MITDMNPDTLGEDNDRTKNLQDFKIDIFFFKALKFFPFPNSSRCFKNIHYILCLELMIPVSRFS